MKNVLVVTLFMLASVAWAAAQQPGSAPDPSSSGRPASPSAQAPDTTQSQPPSAADQSQTRGQAANAPVTEGCLGGREPNYTITDKSGTTYQLNIPANADTSKLASHIGEPVEVLGDVKSQGKSGKSSIDVQGIGKGTGTCPASGPNTPSPKQ